MKHTNTGLSFLSGALLGAAAMYILDPEAGDRRRQAIGAKAGDALRGTGDRLGGAWDQAHKLGADLLSHAQDIGSNLAEGARAGAAGVADRASDISGQAADARDHAYHHLKGLQGKVADLGHDLIGRARDAFDRAQQTARDSTHPLRHKIAHTIDPDHDGHGVGHATAYASAGVGAVALGAAAMYLFDPAKGQERRDRLASQVTKCVQETGHVCRLAGQYVMRFWHGRTDESRDEATNPMVGEQLVQRVRDDISNLLANPAQVQLMADANGMVTLYGRIPPNELDQVLVAINNVPGVAAVIDHLDVEPGAGIYTASNPMESAPQL